MDSISQSSLKKHRKLRNAESDFDFDDPSAASLNHSEASLQKEIRIGRVTPEKLAWIITGIVLGYYSKLYLFILPQYWPQSTYKIPLIMAYVSFVVFFVLFLYLNYYLRYFRGIKITAAHWKRDAPRAVPIATISGSLGFAFLSIGFLPHFHLWTLLIFPILFMSFFALVSLF